MGSPPTTIFTTEYTLNFATRPSGEHPPKRLVGKLKQAAYNCEIMKLLVHTCLISILLCCPAIAKADSNGQRLLELHNLTRISGVRCGLFRKTSAGSLNWNKKLAKAAKSHARNMAKRNKLGHRVKGSTRKRLKRIGYRWSTFGENIASGFTTPESALQGWLKSKQHCRNLMNPDFSEMGAAEHNDYWVVIFATPRL